MPHELGIAIAGALVALVLLRRVPFVGLAIRLVTHLTLLASPLVIVVAIGVAVWFNFAGFLSGGSAPVPEAATATVEERPARSTAPATVPLPPVKPRHPERTGD